MVRFYWCVFVFCLSVVSGGAVAGVFLGADIFRSTNQGEIGGALGYVESDFDWKSGESYSAYMRIEHEVPSIPQLMVSGSNTDIAGGLVGRYGGADISLDARSIGFYYRYYSDWPFEIDLGLALDSADVDAGVTRYGVSSDNRTLPAFFTRFAVVEIVPKLSAEFRLQYATLSGDYLFNSELRFSYKVFNTIPVDGYFYAAYRRVQFLFNDVSGADAYAEQVGLVVGMEWKF